MGHKSIFHLLQHKLTICMQIIEHCVHSGHDTDEMQILAKKKLLSAKKKSRKMRHIV